MTATNTAPSADPAGAVKPGKSLLDVAHKSVPEVASMLGSAGVGKPIRFGPDDYEWTLSFPYPGAKRGQAMLESSDPEGKDTYVWRLVLTYESDIDEKRALAVAGLRPEEWVHDSSDDYLHSQAAPSARVKFARGDDSSSSLTIVL